MENTDNIFISDPGAFGLRLARLREHKSISARELSLSIGPKII